MGTFSLFGLCPAGLPPPPQGLTTCVLARGMAQASLSPPVKRAAVACFAGLPGGRGKSHWVMRVLWPAQLLAHSVHAVRHKLSLRSWAESRPWASW